MQKHQNVLITGTTGVCKTYLACTFGNYACRQGFTTLHYCRPRLLGDLSASRGGGSYLRHLKSLAKADVLIIDDFGLNRLLDTDRKDFLGVIEGRYMSGTTIIAGRLPFKEWYEYYRRTNNCRRYFFWTDCFTRQTNLN